MWHRSLLDFESCDGQLGALFRLQTLASILCTSASILDISSMHRFNVCRYVFFFLMRKCIYKNARAEPKDNCDYVKVRIFYIELICLL